MAQFNVKLRQASCANCTEKRDVADGVVKKLTNILS